MGTILTNSGMWCDEFRLQSRLNSHINSIMRYYSQISAINAKQSLLPISRRIGSIHFWKKHNYSVSETLLYGLSKKVYLPKVDAPEESSYITTYYSQNFAAKTQLN
jgi:hypothetical protein